MLVGSIITVAQSKGGAGKTTLVEVLATNMVRRGYRVAVIDADPNQTCMTWFRDVYRQSAFVCHSEVDDIKVVDLAQQLAEQVDLVLIDTAGFKNLTAQSAIGTADYVLIPCMPDLGCMIEAFKTTDQVKAVSRAARRPIPSVTILTRWKVRGLAERRTGEGLEARELEILSAKISDRASYAQMTFGGAPPDTGILADETDAVIDELIQRKVFGLPVVPA